MKKRIRRAMAVVLSILLMMGNLGVTVYADGDTPSISFYYQDYVNGSKTTQACSSSFSYVTESTTTLTDGWWVVTGTVKCEERLTVSGDVKLVLYDGATLNAQRGITVEGDDSLTIYAGKSSSGSISGTGVLNAQGCLAGQSGTESAAIGSVGGGGASTVGSITINGGVINATTEVGWAAAIGGGIRGGGGNIVINGGRITASVSGGSGYEVIGHGAQGAAVTKSIADGLRAYDSITATTPVNAEDRLNGDSYVRIVPCSHGSGQSTCRYCSNHHISVTYHGNGATSGSVPVDSVLYASDEVVTVLGNTGSLKKSGYALVGWNTEQNGTGEFYEEGDEFNIYDDITLYAVWETAYNVTYHANGATSGTVPAAVTPYPVNGTVTVLGNTGSLAKNGSAFDGWNTRADGKGQRYVEGDTFVLTENVTLYALWNIPYAYIDSTGETQNPRPCTVLYGDVNNLSSGWYAVTSNVTISNRVEISGTVNLILCNGAKLTASKGIHLIAGNQLNIYAQSTGSNMGELVAGPAGANDGRCAGIGGNESEIMGTLEICGGKISAYGGPNGCAGIGNGRYTSNGSGGGTVTIYGGVVTAEAGWEQGAGAGIGGGSSSGGCTVNIYGGTVTAKGSSVYYNDNAGAGIGGGNGANGGTINIYGGTVVAIPGKPTAAALGGGQYRKTNVSLRVEGMRVYNSEEAQTPVNAEDRGAVYQSEYARLEVCTPHNYDQGICVYCGHRASYTVTYNGNGATEGSVPVDDGSYQYGEEITVLGNTGELSKTNFGFGGWCTTQDGTGMTYGANETFSVTENVTLYAKWLPFLSASDFTMTPPENPAYDGVAKTATISTDLSGVGTITLRYYKEGVEVSQENVIDAGTYDVEIDVGLGTHFMPAEGLEMGNFTIGQRAITIRAENKTKTYDGNSATDPALTASVTNAVEGDDIDYSISRVAGQNVGEYTITVSAGVNPNYTVTETAGTFTVTPKSVTVKADDKAKDFDGDASTDPVLTATVTGLLNEDTIQYTLSRVAGQECGEYTITPTGEAKQGNYEVTYETGTLRIALPVVTVKAVDKSKVYGEGDPELTVLITGLHEGDQESDISYAIGRAAGENAGDYTITPSGEASQNGYQVVFETGTFTITPKSIAGAEVALSKTQYTYSGGIIFADVMYVMLDGQILDDDVFTVSNGNYGQEAGNYTVTVTARGNYKDSATAAWSIAPRAVTIRAQNQLINEGASISTHYAKSTLSGAVAGHEVYELTLTAEGNSIIPSNAKIKDSRNNDVTSNYAITYENGVLTYIVKTDVTYLDEEGESHTQECKILTAADSSITGWYAVTEDLSIDHRLYADQNLNLILCNGATLTVHGGIDVMNGLRLTIYAQSDGENMGALVVNQTANFYSGIGGDDYFGTGTIIINGGRIDVTGGAYGAAIGGSSNGSDGTIIINGGVVTANGGRYSAGIGGGEEGKGGGSITINGGTVTAYGGQYGAGIGGGIEENGNTITITINGGTVTAYGGEDGAGIGGGSEGSGCRVTINGGTVIASSNEGIPAIGHGASNGDNGSLTLIGMMVFASESATTPTVFTGVGTAVAGNYVKITPCDHQDGGHVTANCGFCGGNVKYGITCADAEFGTMEVVDDWSHALPEEIVSLIARPSDGYALQTLSVRDENEDEVVVTNLQFGMPMGNVTVYATFAKIHTLSVATRLKTDGSVSVGDVTIDRGAPYLAGDKIVLTAPDKGNAGYRFLGWFPADVAEFTEGNRLAETLRYEVTITGDTSVVAVYETRSKTQVTIGTLNGAKYTVNNSQTQQTGSTEEVALGSTLVLHAAQSNKVLQWQNASGKVLGTGADLSVTVTGPMSILLVYNTVEENNAYVQFVSDSGQVLAYKVIAGEEDVVFPAAPSKLGYRFLKWIIEGTEVEATAANLAARAGQQSLITARPLYELDETMYDITVNYINAQGEAIGDGSKTEAARIGVSHTVTAPAIAGYKFACWKNEAGTQVLGYDANYFMKVSGNITLQACYVAEETEVVAVPVITAGRPFATSAGTGENLVHKITCIITRDVPDGYVLVEQGVLYARGASAYAEDDMVIDGTNLNVTKYQSTDKSPKGTLTANIKTVADGDAWKSIMVSFRGYMILKDPATGNEKVYYTDVVAESYNTLNP